MQKYNEIIFRLIAIKETAKSIHYNCIGDNAYSMHLLADRTAEKLDGYIDRCKENLLLGNDEFPLLSTEYLAHAIDRMPYIIAGENINNFKKLQELIKSTLDEINEVKADAADGNLLGEIADNLKNSYGILNLQVSKSNLEM